MVAGCCSVLNKTMRIERAAQSKFPGPLDVRAGGKALRGMMRTLRNGGLLYILMDQGAKSGGEKAELPGQRLDMPDGAALLARRCRVPLIPAPIVAADLLWKFESQPSVFPESLGRNVPTISISPG